MPKKRNFNRYNKPPSTAPASFASAAGTPSQPPQEKSRPQGVNAILAHLRRANFKAPTSAPQGRPSFPNANDRRLPPGPAPPRSWEEAGRRTAVARSQSKANALPGDYVPSPKSLLRMSLRVIVANWDMVLPYASELQLYLLPNNVRQALLRYLGEALGGSFTLEDFKAIMVPPGDEENDPVNDDFTHISIPSSLLTASTFPSLINLILQKKTRAKSPPRTAVLDSWDAPGYASPTRPRLLLPITHLSLAIFPGGESTTPSWKHLAALSTELHTVTHLSLAFWPAPTRTPNAKFATVTAPDGSRIPYSGTGPYSHSLDDDWSEAINILRMLSKDLYQLEYLDLTGCTAWFPALLADRTTMFDSDAVVESGVDWVGAWGGVETLILKSGVAITDKTLEEQRTVYREGIDMARRVEKHITAQRAGRGKIITVEKDDRYALRPRSGMAVNGA